MIETESQSPARGRRRGPVWRTTKVALFVILAAVVVEVAIGHRDELTGARSYLEDLNPAWLAVAFSAEVVSMLSFTALQQRLLRAGGVAVALRPLVVITLAGNAMANSLPGGSAFASVFAYRQFRRRGADAELAAWTLIAVTGLTGVSLAVLAAAGAAIAGEDNSVGGLLPLVGLLAVGPVLGVLVLLRPRVLVSLGVPVLTAARRLTGYPRREPVGVMTAIVERLEAVTPGLPDWLASLAMAAGNWVFDCTCLVAAFLAVGAPVPFRALLVAYGAAQVAANLPITPGGLGVVEGSLTVALVAFGGSTAATVAAVLVYRILSFWLLLPVGWAAWGGLKFQARRVDGRARPGPVP